MLRFFVASVFVSRHSRYSGTAFAQITWNVTYADGTIRPGGVGFADPAALNGSTHGQLRRNSITAATQYLSTVLDGRGTVNLTFDSSLTSGSGFQAQFGPSQILGTSAGSFQNGGAYQAARTNQHVFGSTDASGRFNFGYGWNYVGQSASESNYDMVTVAIHEITHGLGFLSFTRANGSGLAVPVRPTGTPDIYSVLDRPPAGMESMALFNTNTISSGYGAFIGPLNTLTNGNDPTTGLFFGGEYTREVLNGPAGLYAPNTYEDKVTASHLSDSNALMNSFIGTNSIKRFQDYEIAMLLDIGWNVYSWNGSSGNWGDGASNVNQSRWLSNLGIVTNGSQEFNTFANPSPAPILPVDGQVTSNIVLNFGGNDSTGYTAVNNLRNVRLTRMNLNSTSAQANMISNGVLIFGRHSDGNNSILIPKIIQQNSGRFAINSDIQIQIGLTVDGGGSGQVSLGGATSGSGGLTKGGSFTLELNGSSANTFSGTTTVNAGVLLLNKTSGVNGFAGSLTINPGGTVRLGASDQIPNTATVRLAGGIFGTGQTSGFGEAVGVLELRPQEGSNDVARQERRTEIDPGVLVDFAAQEAAAIGPLLAQDLGASYMGRVVD